MSGTTETTHTKSAGETETTPSDTPRPNGMTDEQVKNRLAALGRRKNDPGYLERVFGAAEEARKQINAEYLRELDAMETNENK